MAVRREGAMVVILRLRGDQIVSQQWLASEDQADVLAAGLTERLGEPGSAVVPMPATLDGWDRMAEQGAVMVPVISQNEGGGQ